MNHNRFLPGFQTAPGPHRALVTRPDVGADVYYHDGPPCERVRNEALLDLERKQRVARALSPVALDASRLEAPPARAGWSELRDRTNAWLDAHLASVDFSDYNPALFPTGEQARQKVLHYAHQGIATINAFQEVTGRAVAWRVDETLSEPNADVAGFAARSRGFIIEWLGLDGATDFKLADAIAVDPTGNPDRVFDDLHFEWIYFDVDAVRREVHLDPEIIPALKFGGDPLVNVLLGS